MDTFHTFQKLDSSLVRERSQGLIPDCESVRALRVEKVFVFYRALALAGAPAGMSTYVYVDGEGDAFRGGGAPQGRKPVQRRTVDYTATTVRHIEVRGDLARDPTTTRA